jgi:hypothetical protein
MRSAAVRFYLGPDITMIASQVGYCRQISYASKITLLQLFTNRLLRLSCFVIGSKRRGRVREHLAERTQTRGESYGLRH